MATEAPKSGAMSKDLIVYVCLLVLAAIQFLIAYQSITPTQMFTRMIVVAVIEASLALLFFMHLADNRGLIWFAIPMRMATHFETNYGDHCGDAGDGARDLGLEAALLLHAQQAGSKPADPDDHVRRLLPLIPRTSPHFGTD